MSSKVGNPGKRKDRPELADVRGSKEYSRAYYERVTAKKNDLLRERATLHRQPWTDEEDRRLIKLDKKGLSYMQIALKLGRTHASVGQRKAYLRREGKL